MPPIFKERIDVEALLNCTKDGSYTKLIERIRGKLKQRPKNVRHIQIEDKTFTYLMNGRMDEYFDIVLRTSNKKITLHVNTEDLYVHSFSNDNGDIPIINSFHYGKITKLTLGKNELFHAVLHLATVQDDKDDKTCNHIWRILIMIIEGVRFKTIQIKLAENMSISECLEEVAMVKTWAALSKQVYETIKKKVEENETEDLSLTDKIKGNPEETIGTIMEKIAMGRMPCDVNYAMFENNLNEWRTKISQRA